MSKADTINIHTLIRKLLQTKNPSTINTFIANYIKGHIAYTIYINHTSSQRQFKTGVPQGGILLPTLFNIYTADIPPPRAPVQVMAYAYDITITFTHTSTSAAKKYIHKVFAWTKQNNLTLNPDTKQFALCSLKTRQTIRALQPSAGQHGWLVQKNSKLGPPLLGEEVSTQFVQQFITTIPTLSLI